MIDATAKLIDLESYRRVRAARRATTQTDAAPSNPFPASFAWFPVWVMPVFFVVASPAAGVSLAR